MTIKDRLKLLRRKTRQWVKGKYAFKDDSDHDVIWNKKMNKFINKKHR